MADFPPIDAAFTEPNDYRVPREYLKELAKFHGNHTYPYTWGFVIFRTVYTYGSDEAFAKALERLDAYARYEAYQDLRSKFYHEAPRDPAVNQELFRRYYNVILEDKDKLANASVDEVGKRFDAWIESNLTAEATKQRDPRLNCRFRYCVMMDQQSIDNILALPEDPDTSPYDDPQKLDRWIKLVSSEQRPDGRFWLRVGVDGLLWAFWFGSEDPDNLIEEVAWEDEVDGVLNYWGNALQGFHV
ncbi:uncharacterized protein F5Z01DRAFT_243435 [Emericellopsis atlantica]|uniref:Uncharacterized protein n=1 Tax=Emericellopsis atlantica TaxID=2614577 RepID=A0A9P7ZHS5_9HYPO|nr:uncharacterized protein F5Z01DRAFT_243435 [Emericellopsis atlantica]KAG9252353.1 hypothetical protein F5Z01DRAFT_243435 [Emericellopsis atlantica]